ncbi:pyroglutamyl-peptidase I [Undibacterium fentianense]|uniref:Pyrrolidone-carboxylate peptidase n=1 Tax=Undibacterium fentianense TaxID=2828728 RepID=A0A941E4K2_9BURK|nr:pyroglutamyl-peptidase I [Undibacterium fentianense]MBR7799633.1 pyroglutamyl-peptidase I [Undibacterium fentianense]
MTPILLTGFAPFDHETMNPSWEVVRRFQHRVIDEEYPIQIAQLPCEFGTANANLVQLLQQHQPSLVICIGQAGGRPEISIERVAINVDDARIPDNAGQQPIDQTIALNGPAAYFSTLPIKAIVKHLRDQGIPANVSQSAGTYVCNHVFYGLMHYANTHPTLKRAGFIHIPYLPEQACLHPGTASMSLDTLENALWQILQTCLEQEKDIRLSTGTIC